MLAYLPNEDFREHGDYHKDIELVMKKVNFTERTQIKYIHVDGNGGTVGGLPECDAPVVGDTIYWPEPVRHGSTFVSWKVVGHEEKNVATMSVAEIVNSGYTFYPEYDTDSSDARVNVEYRFNGGKGMTIGDNKTLEEIKEGTVSTADKVGIDTDKYIFKNWSDVLNGIGGKKYMPGEPLSNILLDRRNEYYKYTSAITFWAQIDRKKMIVEYIYNDTISTQSVVYGLSHKLKENVFKKEGKAFIGWSTEKDGEIVYLDRELVDDIIIKENKEKLRLYPVWADEDDVVRVVYKGNGMSINGVKSYPLVVKKGSTFRRFTVVDDNGKPLTRYVGENGREIRGNVTVTDDMIAQISWR